MISVHSALKCHLYYTNFSQESGVITEVGTKRFYDSTDDDCKTVFWAQWSSYTHELRVAMTTCKDMYKMKWDKKSSMKQGGGQQISPQILASGTRWLLRAGESVFFKDAPEVATHSPVDSPTPMPTLPV